MNYLINGLCIFFIFFISYQIFLAHFKNTEGYSNNKNLHFKRYNITSKNYSNPVKLSQQNAGNIMALTSVIHHLKGKVKTLNNQVTQLVQAQVQSGQDMAGSKPHKITGVT